MTDWAGDLNHLNGTTATEAFDAVDTLTEAFDAEQARRIRAEERVDVLEAAMEFHADPLDPGSYAHAIMVLEGRVGELEAALVESNKNTLTPKQQGAIAARALYPLRAITKGDRDA